MADTDIDSLSADVKACIQAGAPSESCDTIMATQCDPNTGPLANQTYCACINSSDACPFISTKECRLTTAYATTDMTTFSNKYGECKTYCSNSITIDGSTNVSANINQSCGGINDTPYLAILVAILCALGLIYYFHRPPVVIPPPSAYGKNGIPNDYTIIL